MKEKIFEWYNQIENTEDITQGDIFLNIPIVKVTNSKDIFDIDNVEEFEGEIEIEYADYIILTQPCDLARPKADLKNVVLCRIHDVEETQYGKGKLVNIIEGKMPQFYMLDKCDSFKYEDGDFKCNKFNHHIVDFNSIQTIELETLKKYASKVNKRLRLLPPYREHLSQSFAKYFMRIGLPSDIDRSEFDNYKK